MRKKKVGEKAVVQQAVAQAEQQAAQSGSGEYITIG
jgi:hypothetical protein